MKVLTVIKENNGSYTDFFTSITDALNSIPDDNSEYIIKVFPGVYHEKVEIKRNNIIIEGSGSSPSGTIITYSDFARDLMPDGSNRRTFRTYTLLIDASNVTLRNLTIANESGDEHIAGQAIALYADGDKLVIDNCILSSRQDTLFTGPLPPKEIEPGGFIGPKQYDERINGRHYYKNCIIRGNIDFIFGSATAYFESCQIEALSHGESEAIQGFATAPSTPEGQEYGYVFKDCHFTSKECPEASVYLARPWRDYGQTILIDCCMGPHIKSEGFDDWGKALAREVSFFAAYNCKYEDGSAFIPTASFSRNLSPSCTTKYSKSLVLGGEDGWFPN